MTYGAGVYGTQPRRTKSSRASCGQSGLIANPGQRVPDRIAMAWLKLRHSDATASKKSRSCREFKSLSRNCPQSVAAADKVIDAIEEKKAWWRLLQNARLLTVGQPKINASRSVQEQTSNLTPARPGKMTRRMRQHFSGTAYIVQCSQMSRRRPVRRSTAVPQRQYGGTVRMSSQDVNTNATRDIRPRSPKDKASKPHGVFTPF